jgi:hypothetical protein
MRVVASTILLVSVLGTSARGPVVMQNWEQADAATVRLTPAAFAGMGADLREALERRGCLVPQSFSNPVPHNIVRGRFTSAAQLDIAVLCSRQRASAILVFRGGSAALVAELAGRPDADFLQVVGSGAVVGYSRALGVADPTFIQQHHERYGGPKPPPLDHDGINDIFVGKASVVWYWHNGRWLQLQGAD